MWTGADIAGGAFGIYSQPSFLFGIPWGILIGVFVVIMAAYSLVLDFDKIQQGVRNGAPRKYGWLGGFGIMVTVVWLYIEILRILAIARNCAGRVQNGRPAPGGRSALSGTPRMP